MSVQLHIKFVLFFKSKVRPTGEKKFVLLYVLLLEIRLLDPQIFLLVSYVARVEFPVPAFQSGRGSSFLLRQDPECLALLKLSGCPSASGIYSFPGVSASALLMLEHSWSLIEQAGNSSMIMSDVQS